jgi:protein-disulfide isomerase
VKITRREFALGSVSMIALAGFAAMVDPRLGLVMPAAAQESVDVADLMAPGPLPDMAIGDEKAPVTIVEYASMTCPHCAAFHETVYPELKKRYIDTGKVRFIFREFPLDQLAAAGFMLARCAGPDKYFPLIETLFSKQRDWVVQRPLAPLLAIARQAGFTEESFNECLKNQQVLEGIEATRTKATQKFAVQSTPTFFINGKQYRGVMPIEEIEKQIAPYLKG